MIETYLKETELNGQKVYKTYAKVSSLRIDPQNPRDITDDKAAHLMEFLQKYDSFKPLLVDVRPEKEGQLIGGNKRFETYQKMGIEEVWIEPRLPTSDAAAFEMGTLDNMEFGTYMEVKLKEQIHKYEDELGDNIEKLEANLKAGTSFEDLMKPNKNPKQKYEIIIRCTDENDLKDKYSRLVELGIPAKTR